jgi:hypothetical protein
MNRRTCRKLRIKGVKRYGQKQGLFGENTDKALIFIRAVGVDRIELLMSAKNQHWENLSLINKILLCCRIAGI